MDKNEMMKDGVVALVRYVGSLQGYTHTNPRTGNTIQFAGPNAPAKIRDIADAEFYAGKKAFEVELLVLEEPVEAEESKDKDETEPQDEPQNDAEIAEPVVEKKEASKSKPKPKSKGGNK